MSDLNDAPATLLYEELGPGVKYEQRVVLETLVAQGFHAADLETLDFPEQLRWEIRHRTTGEVLESRKLDLHDGAADQA